MFICLPFDIPGSKSKLITVGSLSVIYTTITFYMPNNIVLNMLKYYTVDKYKNTLKTKRLYFNNYC